MRKVLVTLFALMPIVAASAAATAPPKQLEPLVFLIGEWGGAGSGNPGQGAGVATFVRSLQDRVIIRTSYAEYPATGTSPASRHDDLMIIYVAEDGKVRADYYDNEGHVIRYVVTVNGPGDVSFVSEVSSNAPRYRLSYKSAPGDIVKGRFEVAPPGKPDAFTEYLAWDSKKTR
jgi:hypothetical protein